jgi:hypothetical protein
VIGYGFDADRLLVWLEARDPTAPRDDARSGVLCRRHADAMVVPRGWTLDDRRDPTPRLFRPVAGEAPARPPARRRRSRAVRAGGEITATVATLPLAAVEPTAVEPPAVEPPLVARTVAAVTGEPSTTEDPDATVAMPWMPDFDVTDDLGGLLRADSPLLDRAFRGTDRPR